MTLGSDLFLAVPSRSKKDVPAGLSLGQGCQMAKFDPFLSLDCARVEGMGAQSKKKEGIKFCRVV